MAAPEPRIRKKRRRSSPWLLWLLGASAAAVVVAGGFVLFRPAARPRTGMLTGYIAGVATVEQEYVQFHGKLLKDEAVKQQFTEATALVNRSDYTGAAAQLEAVAAKAPVPVVFNDLGIVYAQLGDRARAVNAFREALARDMGYQPVRFNLKRLNGITISSAEPVTQEIEPNNSAALANVIPLGAPVDARIDGGTDVDYFRVNAPPAPRDILEIQIANRSDSLIPSLSVFDSDRRFVGWGKATLQPGATLTQFLSPEPNTTVYLQIWGHQNSGGSYALTVRPQRAFDAYEPNDDILNARRVPVGQDVEAGIMDQRDTDFYSFLAPRSGPVDIQVTNRSHTLVPALTAFSPDMRTSAFGPDVRTAGASLKYTMEVTTGMVYFVQIWSQANSSGAYSLRIQ